MFDKNGACVRWCRVWAVVLSGLFVVMAAGAARGEVNIKKLKIDLRKTQQTFHGWGASMAWWAVEAGAWDDAKLDRLVYLITDVDEGLGLTIFRYNIGGGDQPGHNHMRRHGDVPGFKASEQAEYDWGQDAAQRRVLLRLNEQIEQPIFEAFSNSPPWWMTISGCASGGEENKDNLKPEMEGAFADYLTEVVRAYDQKWGIRFKTLAPFNEPLAGWWKENGNQEGCNVSVAQQIRVLRECAKQKRLKGMGWLDLSACDSNSITNGLKAVRGYQKEGVLGLIAQINTHTYFGHEDREEMKVFAKQVGKRLWQSESGPLNTNGLSHWERTMLMAERIVGDINVMEPETWLTWQILGSTDWGYFKQVKHEEGVRPGARLHTTEPNANFYMMRQFTRFVRPGDVVVRSGEPEEVLIVRTKKGDRVAVVLVNKSREEKVYDLDFGRLGGLYGDAEAWVTSENKQYVKRKLVNVKEMVSVPTSPMSVTTVVLRRKK